MSTRGQVRVLERLRELRSRLRERIRGRPAGGEEYLIGKGAVIERVSKRLDKITERVRERGFIPAAREAIERWEPGRRIREVVAPGTVGGQRLLRREGKGEREERGRGGYPLRK